MASHGRDVLGDYYEDEHLTQEQIRQLGLRVVTEKGASVPDEDLQGKVFRIEDRDDASGYLVSPTETTGSSAVLSYLQTA